MDLFITSSTKINLTNAQRQSIYEFLLQQSENGKLKKRIYERDGNSIFRIKTDDKSDMA